MVDQHHFTPQNWDPDVKFFVEFILGIFLCSEFFVGFILGIFPCSIAAPVGGDRMIDALDEFE